MWGGLKTFGRWLEVAAETRRCVWTKCRCAWRKLFDVLAEQIRQSGVVLGESCLIFWLNKLDKVALRLEKVV